MIKIKDSRKITLFFFVFSLGLIATFILLDILFYEYNIKKKLSDNGFSKINEKENYLKKEIDIPKNILLSIRESTLFKNYLTNDNLFQNEINDIFLMITNQNQNIMQLRYLSVNGMEKIRVDRKKLATSPEIVREGYLQNKASRYYFSDSKLKPLEQVWYSDLDLNMEHGKVEVPYKPTLRAMLPVKNNGRFDGVLIINYYMKNILGELSHISLYDMTLSNEDGYYLIHYNNKKNWSFYKEGKQTLSNEFPSNYNIILNQDKVKGDGFVSKKLDIALPHKLILVLKIKESYFEEYKNDKTLHYFVVGLIIVLLSLLMSFIFSSYLKSLFLILKDTKALNRLLNQRVKKKTSELYEKQKQFQDIVQTINDFIWEVDKDGVYTYVSPQVEQILGYSAKEVIGKTPFDLMPNNEAIKIKQLFTRCIQEEEPIIQLKNKNIHKNGTLVYLETSGNPIYNNAEELIGYRGTDRDITSKIMIEKELEKNHKKIQDLNKNLESKVQEEVAKNHQKDSQLFAQSKMAAMGDMIGNIAHQWRQPLTAISMTASGMKVNYEFEKLDFKTIPKEMDIIVNQTQYLSSTIDTFMEFLKEKKEFKEINLEKVLRHSIQIVKSSLDNNHIKMEVNFKNIEEIKIITIASEIQEVIINIVNNAKDAIKDKNIEPGLVKMSATKNNEVVIIYIEDNAGGIPENIINRIFEPYFTTKHKSQGTGLGLHMAYRVITESLKGKIEVKNSSLGAKFIITLPINKELDNEK